MNKKVILIVVLVVVFIVIGVVVYMFNKSNATATAPVVSTTANTSSTGVSNLVNQKGFASLIGLI